MKLVRTEDLTLATRGELREDLVKSASSTPTELTHDRTRSFVSQSGSDFRGGWRGSADCCHGR